jgi:SPP1 family predicted phage head-tail adaptor
MAEIGPLGAGELDQRIIFQQLSGGLDGLGQQGETWADIATVPTVWAKARPSRSAERFAAGQLQSIADVVFTVRYRADILPSMRILWRGEPYEIVGEPVDVGGMKNRLEISCLGGIRGGR